MGFFRSMESFFGANKGDETHAVELSIEEQEGRRLNNDRSQTGGTNSEGTPKNETVVDLELAIKRAMNSETTRQFLASLVELGDAFESLNPAQAKVLNDKLKELSDYKNTVGMNPDEFRVMIGLESKATDKK